MPSRKRPEKMGESGEVSSLDDSAVAAIAILHSAADLLTRAQPLLSSSSAHVTHQENLVSCVESQLRDILHSLNVLKDVGDIGQAEPEFANQTPIEAAAVKLGPTTAPTLKLSTTTVVQSESHAMAKEAARRIKAARAHEAFVLLDADQNALLDVEELRVALKYMGVEEDAVDGVLERVVVLVGSTREKHDESIAGNITLAEFTSLFTSDPSTDDTLKLLQEGLEEITENLVEEFNRRTIGMVVGNDKWILLDPRSKRSSYWDIFVAVLLIITIFTMPLSMAFVDMQRSLVWLDLLADVTFILDIVKHFNTGYIDEFGFTVMDRKKVRWNYLSSWFVPDMLSSIPIEILELSLGNDKDAGGPSGNINDNLRATRVLKLLRLSRVAKVFRIMKLSKLSKLFREAQDRFEDHFRIQLNEAWLAMTRLFLSLLVLAHWIGCINFMVCREYGFPDDSWVVAADLVDASTQIQYSWCFFKALMEMIGLGFESPPLVNTICTTRTNWCTLEHWITLVCLYIGSIFYALLISSVAFVMANLNKGGSNLSETLWAINEYLTNKKIPSVTRDKVRSFFRIQYSEGKMYHDDEILGVLPPALRTEIMSFNHRQLFEAVPLLSLSEAKRKSPKAFVARLAPVLSPLLVFGGETVFEEDTTGLDLFFVLSGIVQIFSKHCEPVIKAIADGCYFGDVACLMGCKRTATTKARTNTVLSVLQKKDLLQILADYPDVLANMMRVAKARKLRLDSLDASKKVPELLEEHLEDEEDAGTKYFAKLESVTKVQNSIFKAHSFTGLPENAAEAPASPPPLPPDSPSEAPPKSFKVSPADDLSGVAGSSEPPLPSPPPPPAAASEEGNKAWTRTRSSSSSSSSQGEKPASAPPPNALVKRKQRESGSPRDVRGGAPPCELSMVSIGTPI